MKTLVARGIAILLCLAMFLFFFASSREPTAHSQDITMWHNDRIIDIHGHIGTFKGYDLSAPTLLENVRRYGIEMVLISNIDGAELKETRNLDEISANNAAREFLNENSRNFRALLWARPNDGSADNLEKFLTDTSRQFVGIKLHPMMNHFPADDRNVDPYLALCEKYKTPAVFHCDKPGTNGGPEKIYAAARRHPNVPIILYHMVFFGPHSAAIDVVKESKKKRDAQLYLETAQAKPDDVLRAVRELGSERVLFGTDATYFGKDHYAKYELMVQKLRSELSPKDFANVMRQNASRLFRLED
ncbi:MAG: amidohydrolase family protein [Ignavibacteriales bacterium]|nr:amidohydrolase family protein [Ignavibacteriales bacterium]